MYNSSTHDLVNFYLFLVLNEKNRGFAKFSQLFLFYYIQRKRFMFKFTFSLNYIAMQTNGKPKNFAYRSSNSQ